MRLVGQRKHRDPLILGQVTPGQADTGDRELTVPNGDASTSVRRASAANSAEQRLALPQKHTG